MLQVTKYPATAKSPAQRLIIAAELIANGQNGRKPDHNCGGTGFAVFSSARKIGDNSNIKTYNYEYQTISRQSPDRA